MVRVKLDTGHWHGGIDSSNDVEWPEGCFRHGDSWDVFFSDVMGREMDGCSFGCEASRAGTTGARKKGRIAARWLDKKPL